MKSFIRKSIKVCVIGAILLLTALFLFSSFERWRGRKAWVAAKAELTEQGLETNWAKLIPEPIPDAQNLALSRVMTGCYFRDNNQISNWAEAPFFDEAADEAAQAAQDQFAPSKLAALGDTFGFPLSETEALDVFGSQHQERFDELENILKPYRSLLNELRRECNLRPDSYLLGDYSLAPASPFPAFKVVRSAARLLAAEAVLALHTGDARLALDNCRAMTRVANLNPRTPVLVNVMIEVVVLRSYLAEILFTGMSEDLFSIDELREIETLCAEADVVKRLGMSFQFELGCVIDSTLQFNQSPEAVMHEFGRSGEVPLLLGWDALTFDAMITRLLWHFTPAEGWNLQMLSRCAHFVADTTDAFDLEAGTLSFEKLETMQQRMEVIEREHRFFDNLLLMIMPSYQKVAETTVDAQRRIDLLQIVATLCILAKEGQPLPEHLEDLSLLDLTEDPAGQGAYVYEKQANGFTLSSPGHDGVLGSADDLIIHWKPGKTAE